MPTHDTIYALATPPGRSGVAVVRISGPSAADVLSALQVPQPQPRLATLTPLYLPGEETLLDRALVLWFPAPYSFTGEDTVELHLHGSRAVIQSLCEALSGLESVRVAEPGEFSQRAFQNGKMDLTQAEGLADLIEASTATQHRLAMRQMRGELQQRYEIWRKEILEIMAYTEAFIDFPDEDIPEEAQQEITRKVTALQEQLQAHSEDTRGRRIREGFYVAIVGAPNVGKSSLLNRLARQDVAIVSDIPGTTRDAIEVHLDIGGFEVTLCDTAGLRDSNDVVEQEGIRRSHARAEDADLVLCLFDVENPDDPATETLARQTDSLIVMNKVDRHVVPENFTIEGKQIIPLSATEGEGIAALLEILQREIEARLMPDDTPLLTRQRHLDAVRNCLRHLARYQEAVAQSLPPELAAEELRAAAHALGSITGIIDVEEVLGTIFSSFCIGK